VARVGAFLGLDEITNDGHQAGEEGGEDGGEEERGEDGGEEKQQTNPLATGIAVGGTISLKGSVRIEGGEFWWGKPPTKEEEEGQKWKAYIAAEKAKGAEKADKADKGKASQVVDSSFTDVSLSDDDDKKTTKAKKGKKADGKKKKKTEKEDKNEKGKKGTETGDDGEGKKAIYRPVLSDIHFTVNPGCLVAIIGPVGSGKSSLCNALLGEMVQTRGSVRVGGKVAYAAQTAWILNATVRDNILFGQTFEEERCVLLNISVYDSVMFQCTSFAKLTFYLVMRPTKGIGV
jgi:hypothetical protein